MTSRFNFLYVSKIGQYVDVFRLPRNMSHSNPNSLGISLILDIHIDFPTVSSNDPES